MTKEELFKRLKERQLKKVKKKIEDENCGYTSEDLELVNDCKDFGELIFYLEEYEKFTAERMAHTILEVIEEEGKVIDNIEGCGGLDYLARQVCTRCSARGYIDIVDIVGIGSWWQILTDEEQVKVMDRATELLKTDKETPQ